MLSERAAIDSVCSSGDKPTVRSGKLEIPKIFSVFDGIEDRLGRVPPDETGNH